MGSHSPRAVLRIVTELDIQGQVVSSYSEPIAITLHVHDDASTPATRKDREAARPRAVVPIEETTAAPAPPAPAVNEALGDHSARHHLRPEELERLDHLTSAITHRVHPDLEGKSADELSKVPGFSGAVYALRIERVADPVGFVLWRGPARVLSVLRYVEKQTRLGGIPDKKTGKREPIRDRAATIAQMLRQTPPDQRSADERRSFANAAK